MTDAQDSESSGPGILVHGGSADGARLQLSPSQREYRLGSAADCDLQVDLSNIDALHARLTIDGTRLLISDAGSATGTYVNGEKSGPLHELHDGDRISLGPPGSKGSARLLVSLPEGSFTARFVSARRTSSEPGSPEAFGLAPFSGPGQDAEGPWSLLPSDTTASGLELSDASPPFVPTAPLPSDPFSDSSVGLELSGSAEPPFAPSPPPAEPPFGADEPGPSELGGFSARSPESDEPMGLVLGESQDAHDLVLPDMGLPHSIDSPFSAPQTHGPQPTQPTQPTQLEPAMPVVPIEPGPLPDALPPPRPQPARPEYLTELPSIDFGERGPSMDPASPRVPEPRATAGPSPRRAARRRSGFSFSPSRELLAVIGGLVALGLLVGAFFWLRPLFRTPPVVQALSPDRIQPGHVLTISGTGFDTNPSGNSVTIGALAANVTSATRAQLAVMVPAGAAPGGPVSLTVVVTTAGGSSAPINLQVYRAPRITAIEPDVVMPGDLIKVRGENLDGKPLVLSLAGVLMEARQVSAMELEATVPPLPVGPGGRATVSLSIGPDSARPAELLVGRLPIVLSTVPTRGAAGDRVKLTGRGFSPSADQNRVLLGSQAALVLGASPTELTVVVPGSTTGFGEETVPVQVTSNGTASSNPLTFAVTRTSAGSFVPRFFAAPAGEAAGPGIAVVSCELGPYFAFGAKGSDPTTADRAARVASELNALFEQALSKRLSVEIVERPIPGVRVGGSPEALLVVLPEDAAAYPRLQERGASRTRAPSPRALASLWAGLLEDTLSLFAYRERPLRMLELSAKARPFADLYSEALRASGRGAGVPVRLVLPATSSRARSFREMALGPPADAGSRPGAAVEGRWEGQIEANGSRAFQLRLRLDGNVLAGTATAESGKLSMNTPVREAKYVKGHLSFVVDLFGSPRRFTGTVAGDTITGTIERAGGDKAQLGTFTLRYVE